MAPPRARIGYSCVAYVTELLPRYVYRIVPEDVVMSILTLQITSHSKEQFESLYDQGLRAVASFARAGADVIVMGGAPTNISHGEDHLERVLAEMSDTYGVPVSSSAMCQKHALQAVGAKKIGSINPAVPRKIADGASGALSPGMEVIGQRHAGAVLEEYNRIPPERALELGRDLIREHPEVDTLIYGCPHWATIEAIEPLEQEHGVTVITALQAILWEAMRLAGVKDSIDGYGRLLREHDSLPAR